MSVAPEVDVETAVELERLELSLLDPAVRRDPQKVRALLTPDFLEFGASGRTWSLESVVDLLGTETYTSPRVEDFACRALSAETVLVTYRAVREDSAGTRAETLRSSIWTRQSGRWQMCFHQGTRVVP